MKSWLTKAGPYKIERLPCPYIHQSIDMGAPPTGALHTTEGGWNSAMSVFVQHYAPDFLVGAGRIAQLKPLGQMATALAHPYGPATNGICRAQIEVVGHSKTIPYQFDPATFDALVELLALLKKECGIPLVHPFPDTMPPQPWATTNFSRRFAGKWGVTAGWYGHVEVPVNDHWDCGALRWSELLAAAEAKATPPPPPQYRYRVKLRFADGHEKLYSNIAQPNKQVFDKHNFVKEEITDVWVTRRRV